MNQPQNSTPPKKRIACVCPLAPNASTVIGRIVPLAREWQKNVGHTVQLFLLKPRLAPQPAPTNITFTGTEPFTRTQQGKIRLTGLRLSANLLSAAIRTTSALIRFKPDTVIIFKPLPTNVLAVYLWSIINRFHTPRAKIILDVDDFELTANQLSSLLQRAAIHWAERTAARMADDIVVASPFLKDHFRQLTNFHKPCKIIVTGLSVSALSQYKLAPTEGSLLAYFGSISIASGHRVDLLPSILRQVIQHHPNVKLILAGDGDDVASLAQQFRDQKLSDYLIWPGRFQLSQIPKLLTTSTIIIDPIDASIANRAKSSFRCTLATTLGLACVTSDIGIRSFLIPASFHQRFFAAPADAPAYAQKIIDLLNRPITTQEQTTIQYQAKKFDWYILAMQYPL